MLQGRTNLPKAVQIYQLIRDEIISLKLQPGTVINEKEITARTGASRTPLREALIQLVQENLVVVVPGDKTFVSKIRLDEVMEGQLLRDTLESRVVKLAARNYDNKFEPLFDMNMQLQAVAARNKDVDLFFKFDNEFHELICACAGHKNIWSLIRRGTAQLDRIRRFSFVLEDSFDTVMDEHRKMVDNIKSRSQDEAVKVFHIQIDSIVESINILLMRRPDLVEGHTDLSLDSIR